METLSQIMARSPQGICFPRWQGELEISTLRQGQVTKHLRQKNLSTRTLHEYLNRRGSQIDTWYMLLSNDQDNFNSRKTFVMSSMSRDGTTNAVQSSSKTINTVTKTWEFRATWGTPPPEDRTISWVGIGRLGTYNNVNLDLMGDVICGTRLSSAITQLGGVETLSVVYRFAFVYVG